MRDTVTFEYLLQYVIWSAWRGVCGVCIVSYLECGIVPSIRHSKERGLQNQNIETAAQSREIILMDYSTMHNHVKTSKPTAQLP